MENNDQPTKKTLSVKDKKEKAKSFLKILLQDEAKPKFNSEFITLEYNEKGKFFSAIISVDATLEGEDCKLVINRDIKFPINLIEDVEFI